MEVKLFDYNGDVVKVNVSDDAEKIIGVVGGSMIMLYSFYKSLMPIIDDDKYESAFCIPDSDI